jgi:hypothetical protein
MSVLNSLRDFYETLPDDQKLLMLVAERELLPSYERAYLVTASKAYRTGESKPILSIFTDLPDPLLLTRDERATFDTVREYALRGRGHCFATLRTLVQRLGKSLYLAARSVRQLAERGYWALLKVPVRRNPDPSNPHHWRMQVWMHPIFLHGDRFAEELLARFQQLVDEARASKTPEVAPALTGEKRGEIVEHYLREGVDVRPTAYGEKRPAYSEETWGRYGDVRKRFLLADEDADLIIKVPTGYVVLDFDDDLKHRAFLRRNPDLRTAFINTLRVKTPRGYHYWFRTPVGVRITQRNCDFFDIRPAGSWLVVPSGGVDRYHDSDSAEICLLPARLLGDIFTPAPPSGITRLCYSPVNLPRRIEVGARNNTLFRLGRSLRWKIGVFDEFTQAMKQVARACAEALPERELTKLIRNIWTLPNRSDFVRVQ